MISQPPEQLVTVTPFAPRDWVTLCKDYAVLFPTLDYDPTTETVEDGLLRPLRGENVFITGGTVSGAFWKNRIVRDSDFLDTGLQVTRKSATSLDVTAGACLCTGVYLQICDSTTTISLGDSSSFFTITTPAYPVVPSIDYYLVIMPDVVGAAGFGFALVIADEWETFAASTQDIGTILACITMNGSGQIQNSASITFTRGTFWDREQWTYPLTPSLDPLNGGVVVGSTWYEDWP